MVMTPNVRKFALTLHITFSVAWIGAVASFLALAIAGLISRDEAITRACYVAMDLITSFVILPLVVASLLTGIVSSIGTAWGLFRHYWVLLKLLLTIACIIILFVHLQPIAVLAGEAEKMTGLSAELRGQQILMVVAASAALAVLLLLAALSVYKLRGVTPYGTREQGSTAVGSDSPRTVSTPLWVKWVGVIAIALVLLFVILHLSGKNPGGNHIRWQTPGASGDHPATYHPMASQLNHRRFAALFFASAPPPGARFFQQRQSERSLA